MGDMVLGAREGLERLFSAFVVQVHEIEARVRAGGTAIADDHKTLSGMVKTLESLVAIDRKVAAPADKALDSERLRAELAERLKRLRSAKPARMRVAKAGA